MTKYEKREGLAAKLFAAFVFILIVVLLILAGCHPDGPPRKSNRDLAVDACIKAGGVPILSKFNGALNECQFPPAKGGG